MGRPPKPIEEKRLTGNPGKRRLPPPSKALAVLTPGGDAIPPVPMSLGPDGREIWRWAWTAAPWLSPVVDLLGVKQLAELAEDVSALRKLIATRGYELEEPIVTPAGHVVGTRYIANPLLKELRSAEKQLDGLRSALALDPTSRSRLGLEIVKTHSKLEQLIAQSRQRRTS